MNTNNIVEKVKENTVPEGAFGISAKGKAEALNNRINAATGIPADLPEGSFGISEAARAEALANRREVITNRVESQTGISGDLPAGSFGISAAGREQALTNRIESQTGIPADLPAGAFTVTPKKKFNLPSVNDLDLVKKTNKSGIPKRILEAYPELDPTNPRDYLKLKRLQRESPIDLALNDGGDQ